MAFYNKYRTRLIVCVLKNVLCRLRRVIMCFKHPELISNVKKLSNYFYIDLKICLIMNK